MAAERHLVELEWFGARLKELRERAGLSQPKLAELAGMNRFGVAKLEQGVTKPTWETVLVLAKALGTDCTAFTVKPSETGGARRGRPSKSKAERARQREENAAPDATEPKRKKTRRER